MLHTNPNNIFNMHVFIHLCTVAAKYRKWAAPFTIEKSQYKHYTRGLVMKEGQSNAPSVLLWYISISASAKIIAKLLSY